MADNRSDDALRALAESQIASEIQGQIGPYQGQIDVAQGRERRSLGDISSMFANLMPWVARGASNVQQSWNLAQQGERQTFDQAFQRLNSLKQSRAAEAQALAQEIGGPVATSQFMEATQGAEGALGDVAGNSLLHGLALGQAGVQEANSFAGKVFPALRTETEAKAKAYYEDQIKGYQDQIASIKSQKPGQVDQRYNDLLEKEREFRLQKAQLGLQKTQAAHDWYATKQGILQENRRIKDAEKQFDVTSKQTDRQISDQEKQFQKNYGLSTQAASRDWQLHQQDLRNQQAATAIQLLDSLTSPGSVQSVTNTQNIPVAAPADPRHPPSGYYAEPILKNGKPTGKVQWFKTTTQTTSGYTGNPVHDPNKLYDYLTSANIPRPMAIKMIRAKLGLPATWQPHSKPKKPVNTAKPSKPGRGD